MICENIENVDYNNIIINDPIKNSVLQYNYFYKLLYSTDIVVLSSVFIIFELNNIVMENDKVIFNKNSNNTDVFNKLIALEEYILNLINESKTKLYKFKELYEHQYFKFSISDDVERFNDYNNIKLLEVKNNNKKFILKISGIWESKDNIGLTFKIIIADKCISFT